MSRIRRLRLRKGRVFTGDTGLTRVCSRVEHQKRPVFIDLSRCHGSARGRAEMSNDPPPLGSYGETSQCSMSKEERVWTSGRCEIHLRGFAGFLPTLGHDRDMFDRPEVGSREGFRDGLCHSTSIETARLSNGFSPRRHSGFAFGGSLCASGPTRSGPGQQAGQTWLLTGFGRVCPALTG